jgi:hypothetical protein
VDGFNQSCIVFDVDRPTIEEWLSGAPPWNESWQQGNFREHLAFHEQEGVMWYSSNKRELIAIDPYRMQVWYVRRWWTL